MVFKRMIKEQQNIITCSTFEELLSEYLDKSLDGRAHKSVAAHALACPLCHSLLNEVKDSLEVCRRISAPAGPITRLEARVLSMTMPETAMKCEDFESSLTDYLDGFLPAAAFHRWERHAALCNSCEDLPGIVVRSIAACYTYKTEELAVPSGLHQRIMNLTWHAAPIEADQSWTARVADWLRGRRFPIAVPQLAPVAMMLTFAFLIFSQTVSADGTLTGVYQTSYELAEKTYKQGADVLNGRATGFDAADEPINGTTTVEHEESKKN